MAAAQQFLCTALLLELSILKVNGGVHGVCTEAGLVAARQFLSDHHDCLRCKLQAQGRLFAGAAAAFVVGEASIHLVRLELINSMLPLICSSPSSHFAPTYKVFVLSIEASS